MSEHLLVTGADGTVGSELVHRLTQAEADVRAGVHHRHAHPTREIDAPNVQIDFDDPDSLREAFDGIDTIYLLTPQTPQSVEQVRAAVSAARDAGVKRIVRHSVCHASSAPDELSRWHREAEELVAASGLVFTVLRPNAFMQNFVTIYRDDIAADDLFRLPLGDARLSNVDVRDIAAVAAEVMLTREYDGEVLTLTGREALSGDEMAAALSEAAGRAIRYLDEPEDAHRRPRDAVRLAESRALRELAVELRAGRLAAVTTDVHDVIGHKARTFARFARDYAWAFVPAARSAARR